MEEDPIMAGQAVHWLRRQKKGAKPFCLTVSLVNPHDKQFFWSGTEAIALPAPLRARGRDSTINFLSHTRVRESRATTATQPLPATGSRRNNWLPTNPAAGPSPASSVLWCMAMRPERPTDKFSFRDFRGSFLQDRCRPVRVLAQEPGLLHAGHGDGGQGDRPGGPAIPRELRDDTIIILTSDHGEYAGAHGCCPARKGPSTRSA